MNRNECRAIQREIDESEIDARLSERTQLHLAVCSSCAEFRNQRSRLRELISGLAPVTAPADFDMRLRARMAREGKQPRQPSIFRLLISTPGIAVAAVVVTLIGSIVWINQRNRTEAPSSAIVQKVEETPRILTTSTTASTKENSTAEIRTGPDVPSPNPRSANRSSRRNKPAYVANAPAQSSDFTVSQAPSIRLNPERAGEVSLSAPVNPMVVSVRDRHGGTRRILLPPVSFGSQRLTDNRVPVVMNNTRDW